MENIIPCQKIKILYNFFHITQLYDFFKIQFRITLIKQIEKNPDKNTIWQIVIFVKGKSGYFVFVLRS